MARKVELNKPVIDEFSPFESDNKTKRSGLDKTDFTYLVLYNKTIQNIPFTIGEYGATGSYWVQFTPDKLGFWEFEVTVNFSGQIWFETFDVVIKRELADLYNQVHGSVVWDESTKKFTCVSWLQRNGEIMMTPQQCKWTFYDSENVQLFSLQDTTPYGNGMFKADKYWNSLPSDKTYHYVCEIHDGVRWIKSGLSFVVLL